MLAIRLVTDSAEADALALPVRRVTSGGEDGPGATLLPTTGVPDPLAAEATALLPLIERPGESGEVRPHLRPSGAPTRLFLVGVGDGDEAGWRAAGAGIARSTAHESSITIVMPTDVEAGAVRGLAEGLWLASYRFRMPGDGGEDGTTGQTEVRVVVDDPDRYAATLDTAQVVARMTCFARDLTNMPSSVKSPAWFADQITAAAAGYDGLTVSVREPDQLVEEGFGGILAVGGGSAQTPRLVELSYQPADAVTHVVLVGKGITFDTGGISIKPRDGMKLMRKDMAGAAAVTAATIGIAALRLPVRVTALAPLAENMPSGSAFRPGDVIRHYGGATSETTNSDAEGRLVLADALAYAVKQLQPDLLLDLATLTGANAVALGKRTGALYSDNDELAAGVLGAAAEAGERAWRMPLPSDYLEYLGSDLADLYSCPEQGAGSVMAALYLREFTGGLRDRWLHIDMSAPSWVEVNEAELVKGATGWGVRTLLRWAEFAGPRSARAGSRACQAAL